MATFHSDGKFNLTILIGELGVAEIAKKCLYNMFGFQVGFLDISMDIAYNENNVLINSIY
jgi:hypothetical protein